MSHMNAPHTTTRTQSKHDAFTPSSKKNYYGQTAFTPPAPLGAVNQERFLERRLVGAQVGLDGGGDRGIVNMSLLGPLGAVGYGVFMGSYPVPIKSPRVRNANVHPIVFQCYKSFWVMVTGFMFAVPVYVSGEQLHTTWWAVLAAACWVPSGTCTIASVMLNGVSLSIVLNSASAAISSFLVFWLVLGEPLKKHEVLGHEIVLAPVWLAGCVLGMVGLVYGPQLPGHCRVVVGSHHRATHSEPFLDGAADSVVCTDVEGGADGAAGAAAGPAGAGRGAVGVADAAKPRASEHARLAHFGLGVFLAIFAGLLGAGQYAVQTIGRSIEEHKAGCAHNTTACPAALRESFEPLGSWSFMFGLGAAGVTALLLAALTAYRCVSGGRRPSLEFEVMRLPGSLAGLLWVLGNLGGELSVQHGGNSVEVPTMTSLQLVVSGAWGIAYYGELKGRCEVAVWVGFALWTVLMVVLLAMERSK